MSQPLAEGALGVSEAFTARACSGRELQWWPFLPMSWFVPFKKGFPVYGQEDLLSSLCMCLAPCSGDRGIGKFSVPPETWAKYYYGNLRWYAGQPRKMQQLGYSTQLTFFLPLFV